MESQKKQVTVLGSPIKYWVYGDPVGVPCVLVHGFRGDHHGMEKIVTELLKIRSGLYLIVPDLPGFGETQAIPEQIHSLALYGNHLCKFVEALELTDYRVMGHSFGTLVVSAALQHGLTPTSVILVNPISRPALSGPNRIMSLAAKQYYEIGRKLPKKIGHKLLSNAAATRLMSELMAKTRDKELKSWIHAEHNRYFGGFNDRDALAQAFDASISNTVGDFASCFSVPTFILAGEKDELATALEQFELTQKIKDAKMHIMYGTGHLSHYEKPTEIARHSVEFWDDLGL